MSFDFFALKVKAQSSVADDILLGYFFGKLNKTIEFRFICYPKLMDSYHNLKIKENFFSFKEKINEVFQLLIFKYMQVNEMTSRSIHNINSRIKSLGGKTVVCSQISTFLLANDTDQIKQYLGSIFEQVAEKFAIDLNVELFSFSEITEFITDKTNDEAMVSSVASRNDLISLPEVYPVIDPIDGIPIDLLKVGDTVFCTLLSDSDEDLYDLLIKEFPKNFSEDRKNIIPLKGIITSKEFIKLKSGDFYLIKIVIGSQLVAKSYVLKNIRLIAKEEKLSKYYSEEEEKDFLFDEMQSLGDKKIKKNKANDNNSSSQSFDMMLLLIVVGIIFIFALILYYLLR